MLLVVLVKTSSPNSNANHYFCGVIPDRRGNRPFLLVKFSYAGFLFAFFNQPPTSYEKQTGA